MRTELVIMVEISEDVYHALPSLEFFELDHLSSVAMMHIAAVRKHFQVSHDFHALRLPEREYHWFSSMQSYSKRR